MLRAPTRILPDIRTPMRSLPRFVHPRTWTCCTIPPESPSRGRHLLADLLKDRVVALEIGRHEIRRGVRVPAGPRNETVLLKEFEMVADRAVVKPKGFAELIRVVRSFMECLEDSCAVHPSAGAGDEVPQELSEGRSHGARRL